MAIFLIILSAIALLLGFVVFFGAPYVPSRKRLLYAAFTELRPLLDTDVLLDLGSGDGVVLREAVRAGAGRAVGFELNPLLVLIANWLSRSDKRVSTRIANIWRVSFPVDVTLIYIFAEDRDIKKIDQRIQSEVNRLNRSIEVMSFAFKLPNRIPKAESKSYFLYKVNPLQSK